jgi:hypothetical protein
VVIEATRRDLLGFPTELEAAQTISIDISPADDQHPVPMNFTAIQDAQELQLIARSNLSLRHP